MQLAPSASELVAGTVIADSYQLVKAVGRGAMGTVWKARHLRLPREVAIKVMIALGDAKADADAYARFRREAEIVSRIGHPNIVEVLDFNNLPSGAPYIVMELLSGESLASRIDHGPIPPPLVLTLTAQIASALDAAHRQHVVHRDLKPDNIFLQSREGGDHIKVLDFGVSKIRGSQTVRTQNDVLIGTPQYMAPEQATGHNESLDHRADIFALGAIVYEMLAGEPAFAGSSLAQVVYKVVHGATPSLAARMPWLPASAVRAVETALEKDPARRFQDARSFVAALGELARTPAMASAGGEGTAHPVQGTAVAQPMPGSQPPYAPQGYVPTPQGYVPTPQNYVPTPQNYVPTPQNYVPTPQNYVPTPQNYVPTPQGYLQGQAPTPAPGSQPAVPQAVPSLASSPVLLPGSQPPGRPTPGRILDPVAFDHTMAGHGTPAPAPASGPARKRRWPVLVALGVLAAGVTALIVFTRSGGDGGKGKSEQVAAAAAPGGAARLPPPAAHPVAVLADAGAPAQGALIAARPDAGTALVATPASATPTPTPAAATPSPVPAAPSPPPAAIPTPSGKGRLPAGWKARDWKAQSMGGSAPSASASSPSKLAQPVAPMPAPGPVAKAGPAVTAAAPKDKPKYYIPGNVPGGLDFDDWNEMFMSRVARNRQLAKCLDDLAPHVPDLKGVEVSFTVHFDTLGVVTAVTTDMNFSIIQQHSFIDWEKAMGGKAEAVAEQHKVSACLARTIKAWKLPAMDGYETGGGTTPVLYQ